MIDTLPDAEQRQMVEATAAALDALLPVERLRTPDGAMAETRQWRSLAELGWFGLALPEAAGGAGATTAEEALLHLHFGRHLVSPAVLAATLAARVALAAGDVALARAIASGERRVGILTARGAPLLVAADDAGMLVRWDAEGATLLSRDGLGTATPLPSLDATVSLGRVAPPSIAPTHAAGPEIARHAELLLAAQLAGIAETTAERAAAHAKLRQQFGRPIGAFQAVAHHCADMAMRARAARAQALFAAVALRDARPDATFQLAAAALLAGQAALGNAALSIRVHGAMGYTAEGPLHHYLKRAHLLQALGAGKPAQGAVLLAAEGALVGVAEHGG